MKIGVLKENKNGENRVVMTPINVKTLIDAGHDVVVQSDAGIGSGYSNEEYIDAGASIVSQEEAWNVDLVSKVKEPEPEEYKFFKKDLIFWGFLHLAASRECVEAMQKSGMTGVAVESVNKDGVYVLLKPMSAVAGRRAIMVAANFLGKHYGGSGVLISGIEGVPPGNVLILGGGNVAVNAAEMALGLGANVTMLELNESRIEQLKEMYAGQSMTVLKSTTEELEKQIKEADILVSTILIPGANPPKIVKEYMVKTMKPGSVIVDVSIDQGGTIETIAKSTSLEDPIFIKHDVLHYAVPNMPGETPRTSTIALAKGNLEYVLSIANDGIKGSIDKYPELYEAVNIYKGNVVYENLAKSLDIDWTELKDLI